MLGKSFKTSKMELSFELLIPAMVLDLLMPKEKATKKWSHKHFCCRDDSYYICADYRRTNRANLCLSVIKSMRKVDKPNGPKFQQIVERILRNC